MFLWGREKTARKQIFNSLTLYYERNDKLACILTQSKSEKIKQKI